VIGFFQHIIRYTRLTSDEFLSLVPFLEVIKVPKKTKFVAYGDQSIYCYFVLEGLVYVQYEGSQGEICITTFVSENEWVNSGLYDFERSLSLYEYVSVEHSTLIRIKKGDLKMILERYPSLHFYFGKCQDYRNYKLDIAKISHSVNKSTTRFELFKNGYEHLLDRIPLQLVASYLNMKPETLSRSKRKNK